MYSPQHLAYVGSPVNKYLVHSGQLRKEGVKIVLGVEWGLKEQGIE